MKPTFDMREIKTSSFSKTYVSYRKPRKLSDEQREQSRQQDNYLQSYTKPLSQKSINSWIFPNIPFLHPSLLLAIIQVIVEKRAWLLK